MVFCVNLGNTYLTKLLELFMILYFPLTLITAISSGPLHALPSSSHSFCPRKGPASVLLLALHLEHTLFLFFINWIFFLRMLFIIIRFLYLFLYIFKQLFLLSSGIFKLNFDYQPAHRSFAPSVWNNIPLSLRNSLTRNNHKSTSRSFFLKTSSKLIAA